MSSHVPRAENVGSLLQPERLVMARRGVQDGSVPPAEFAALEDEAVLAAIALQESVGLDIITDGEMRRRSWATTVHYLKGIEPRFSARSYPASAAQAIEDATFPTVVARVRPVAGTGVGDEYPFLAAHARRRTKYTMAAPSYHRRYWSDTMSRDAYDRCEDFLWDVRDFLASVAASLVAAGCTYIQLDAPNYGSLCDPDNRRFHSDLGHDLNAEIAFDAALDSSVFEGLAVTSALHVCRGNQPGAAWHSSGGYGAIAEPLFSNLDVDTVLLEYDSDRAGDFSPLSAVQPDTVVVLGLLTTKRADLEHEFDLEARIAEASTVKPLGELALSTQCGFSSAVNAPMTEDQQRAKLELVATVADRVWR